MMEQLRNGSLHWLKSMRCGKMIDAALYVTQIAPENCQ